MLSDTAGLPTSRLPGSRSFAAQMPIKENAEREHYLEGLRRVGVD
jgi:hypothetical protein